MNIHGENTHDEGVDPVQHLLQRFKPVGPPTELRKRILSEISFVTAKRRPLRVAVYVWRAAVAAGLIAAVWLNTEAEGVSARIFGRIGIGPAVWTRHDEQIAHDLNGEGRGRLYLAMALRSGPLSGSTEIPSALGSGISPRSRTGE